MTLNESIQYEKTHGKTKFRILRYKYKYGLHFWTHKFVTFEDCRDHFRKLREFICYASLNGRTFYWGN